MRVERMKVRVPVSVQPFAKAGKTRVYCCGEPRLIPDNRRAQDVADGGCNYILRQCVYMDIPIRVHARAEAFEPQVLCDWSE